MIRPQHTLAGPVEMEGVGLFFGAPVRLRCLPAEAGTGVRFIRVDLPGRPEVRASTDSLVGPKRWTALKNGAAEVSMVEHLLAGLAGLGIDNATIETTAAEMPVGDGSARVFVDAFLKAGLRRLDAPAVILRPNRPLAVTDGDVILAAAPAEDALTVTYALDYGRAFLRNQTCTFTVDRDIFVREIAPARTYVLRPEVDAFIRQGLGKGATPENTVVLEPNGETSVPLRFPDEFVRHKVLDLIGDLFLAGGPSAARVIGYKSGHAANVQLARALRDACRAPQSDRQGTS